ncbi:MAG: hypothetical protein DCC49_04825 [Acidobacteria bacterium]|nr:MAG: hypothetical protein DCC49_04825 [Acidobacteriota bacterium]
MPDRFVGLVKLLLGTRQPLDVRADQQIRFGVRGGSRRAQQSCDTQTHQEDQRGGGCDKNHNLRI